MRGSDSPLISFPFFTSVVQFQLPDDHRWLKKRGCPGEKRKANDAQLWMLRHKYTHTHITLTHTHTQWSTHTHTHTYTTHTHTTHTHTHTHTHTSTQHTHMLHTQASTNAHIQESRRTVILAPFWDNTGTYVYIHIYMHTCIYIHTSHIHTKVGTNRDFCTIFGTTHKARIRKLVLTCSAHTKIHMDKVRNWISVSL
jgi:hypothetical protein